MHDMSMELSYLPWGTGKRACFCGLPCLLSKGTLSPTSGPQEKQPSALTFAQSIIPLPFPSPAGRREDFIHSLSLAYPLEMIFPLQCWFFYYFHTISWAQESWWRGSQVTVWVDLTFFARPCWSHSPPELRLLEIPPNWHHQSLRLNWENFKSFYGLFHKMRILMFFLMIKVILALYKNLKWCRELETVGRETS